MIQPNNTIQLKPRRVRILTASAMLAAISFVLAFMEFPMPLAPSFAKFDLSDLPALIAGFAFGPLSGILVEFIKNLLQALSSSTSFIGELANFMMGASFVGIAGAVYGHKKSRKQALLACAAGSLVMGIVAALTTYFLLLPMYELFMPMEQVIASFGAVIPFIRTKLDVVLFSALPGTVVKGLLISAITMLIYKRISPLLKGTR